MCLEVVMLRRISPKIAVHFLDPRLETSLVHYAIENGEGRRVGECQVAYRGDFGSSLQHTWVLANI
jgi:hypothetical protein